MYKNFFGLSRNPFELSPDPSFLCPLGKSEEALASIYHAVERRKGFVVLSGEVGTGKTLTVRYLCELWKDRQIPFANVIGPRLSVTDFLTYVAFDLGIKVSEPGKGNLLRGLYQFLLAQFEKGLTTVLIVDEAHQLPGAVLEEIRLLTNFETAQEKLLQILLVGQPELETKLDSFELRQLKQRIAIRCQLEPLTEDETRSYVERRLTLAGATSQASSIFPPDTVHAIYHYSMGTPRLVNSICEQALLAAYARQVSVIPAEIIDEVAAYFRLRQTPDLTRVKHPVAPLEKAKGLLARTESRSEGIASASVDGDPATEALSSWPEDQTGLCEKDAAITSASLPEQTDVLELQPMTASNSVCTESAPKTEEVPTLIATNSNGQVLVSEASSTLSKLETEIAQVDSLVGFGTFENAKEKFLDDTVTEATPEEDKAAKAAGPTIKALVARSINQPEVAIPRPASEASRHLRKRGVIPVLAILFFLLAGGGVWLFRVLAAAKPAPELLRIQPIETRVPFISQSEQADSVSDQPEKHRSAESIVSQGKVSRAAGLHEGNRVRPKNQPLANVPSLLSGSRNDAHPNSRPPRWTRESTVPPDLKTAESNRNSGGLSTISVVRAPTAPPAETTTRQQGGRVKPARLISSVPVVYPTVAQSTNIQGDVVIEAVIDENGRVGDMSVVSGALVLRQAALDALRQWRYEPGLLDGQPVPVQVIATIQFRQ